MLVARAGLAAAAPVVSGADESLGLEVSGVSGALVCCGFLGADVTVDGMDLGVEVDGPALGVRFDVSIDLDLVLNIVGVRPVSRKTSVIEPGRFRVSSSESSPNSCNGICSEIPSSFEIASSCRSISEDVEGAIRKRVNDGILLAGITFGFGIDRTLGMAPAGLLR